MKTTIALNEFKIDLRVFIVNYLIINYKNFKFEKLRRMEQQKRVESGWPQWRKCMPATFFNI